MPDVLSSDREPSVITKPITLADCNRFMNHNAYHGVALERLVYWHSPSKRDGIQRCRIQRGGHYWLVKTYDELAAETGLKSRTIKDALQKLKNAGLLTLEFHHFNGRKNVPHIRLRLEALAAAIGRGQSISSLSPADQPAPERRQTSPTMKRQTALTPAPRERQTALISPAPDASRQLQSRINDARRRIYTILFLINLFSKQGFDSEKEDLIHGKIEGFPDQQNRAVDERQEIPYAHAWNWARGQLIQQNPDLKWHLRDAQLLMVQDKTFHLAVASEQARDYCASRARRAILAALRMLLDFEPELRFQVDERLKAPHVFQEMPLYAIAGEEGKPAPRRAGSRR